MSFEDIRYKYNTSEKLMEYFKEYYLTYRKEQLYSLSNELSEYFNDLNNKIFDLKINLKKDYLLKKISFDSWEHYHIALDLSNHKLNKIKDIPRFIKTSIEWNDYLGGVREIYIYDNLDDFIWSFNKIEKDFNDLKMEINYDNNKRN